MHIAFRSCALAAMVAMLPLSKAAAVYPATSFAEVAQTADLVFSGTVTSQDYLTSRGAPYTEVTFANTSIHNNTPASRQRNTDTIKLLYAGGPMADGMLTVSGTPKLVTGEKYFICMLDDGKNYFNPIVGGPQGLFRVIADEATGKEYVVNFAGKSITGIENEKLSLSTVKLASVINGTPQYEKPNDSRNQPIAAYSADGTMAVAGVVETGDADAVPISLSTFTEVILPQALQHPVKKPRLKRGGNGGGKFYRSENGRLAAEPLTSMSQKLEPIPNPLPDTRTPVPENTAKGTRGQTLVACEWQRLHITMERVPSSWWMYDINEACMSLHNKFMDVYRVTNSDGSVGINGTSEFGGSVSSADLQRIYGFTWDTSVGVCLGKTESTESCSRITEADIFWNPSYSFTDDVNVWFGNDNDVFNFRAMIIHELGHTWGYQLNGEQYDYDRASIMHAIYYNVYETGAGFHAVDADIFRRHYSDQTSVLNITDLGVESYFASNGLINSGINGSIFGRGQNMAFQNVTVENMSNSTVSNVRLRFYLCTTRDFATGTYYQVGGDWTYTPFGPASASRNSFNTNTIPNHVPPGSYYVLAYVDAPGVTDDYGNNNTTVFADKVTITAPTISRSPASLSSTVTFGSDASNEFINIQNTGSGTLNYSMSISYNGANSGWLSLNQYSGTSTGETDSYFAIYDTSSLPVGTHTATISISDPSATNNPQTISVSVTVQPPPAPGNNNLLSAYSLSGMSGTITGSNAYATKETGEGNHAGVTGGASVWWSWTPLATGAAVINTDGSSFDTVLAVYTGSFYPLNLIVQNDDAIGPTNRQSRVNFTATSGTNYKIAVDGFSANTGNITLNHSLTPFNSTIADWSMY